MICRHLFLHVPEAGILRPHFGFGLFLRARVLVELSGVDVFEAPGVTETGEP